MGSVFTWCGLRFEVKMVPVARIISDPDYQRSRCGSLEKEIADNFMPECFDMPLICERSNGDLVVPDGQTRTNVCMRRGEKIMPARVVKSRGKEHEALIFGRINKFKRQVSSFDLHNANVTAKVPASVEMNEAIERLGFCISKNRAWPNIACVSKAERLFKNGTLTDVLNTIAAAWNGNKQALQDTVLSGLDMFFKSYPDADRQRLVKVLHPKNPDHLVSEAVVAKGVGGGRYGAFAKVVENLYNLRLGQEKKLRIVG